MALSADVVVIGAGIIGCASAYFLAQGGRRVILVERDDIASGTASASGGWVIIQDKETPDGVAFARESRRLYDRLQEEAGVPLHRAGGLILATSDLDLARLRTQAVTASAGGLAVELLDAAALRDLEPALSPEVRQGLFCADEATVDPPQVCRALVRGAQQRGAQLLTRSPAVGITVSRDAVTEVQTTTHRIVTSAVVCACGVWSPAIGRLVGVEIPVIPRRGHIVVTEPLSLAGRPMLEAGYLEGSGDSQAEDPHGLRFVLQPRVDGRSLVGSSREFRGFERDPDPDLVRQLWMRAVRFVPALARTRIESTIVGLRPYTPLGRPIIGWAGPQGFLVATGHEGEGITLAPITGKLVEDLVAGRITQTGYELH